MKISQEKLDRLKSRARKVGSMAAAGWKDSAKAAGAGAASFYVADFASQKVEALRKDWWALPVAMAVGGHFLRRKSQVAGLAMLGAAGYQGALSYKMKQALDAQNKNAPPPAPDARGMDDDYAPELDAAAVGDPTGSGAPTAGAPSAYDAAALPAPNEYQAYDYSEAAALQT
jgi:hypothetical protein